MNRIAFGNWLLGNFLDASLRTGVYRELNIFSNGRKRKNDLLRYEGSWCRYGTRCEYGPVFFSASIFFHRSYLYFEIPRFQGLNSLSNLFGPWYRFYSLRFILLRKQKDDFRPMICIFKQTPRLLNDSIDHAVRSFRNV